MAIVNPLDALALGQQQQQQFQLGGQSIQANQQKLQADQAAQQAAAARQAQLAGLQQQLGQGATPQQQLEQQFPDQAQAAADAIKARFGALEARDKQRFQSIAQGFQMVKGQPPQQQLTMLKARSAQLRADGVPSEDTDEVINLLEAGQVDDAQVLIDGAVNAGQALGLLEAPGTALTAGEREFSALTQGLTPEQQKEARRIKLGLAPRTGISAQERIAGTPGAAEQIGESQAIIEQRKEFGKKTGASRAKAIDSGFERIGKIETNINNLDRAIQAVEAGAGTGAIERRFPSIKAASVELDQIQGELALDVIGAVTFGALSEGELDLAKQIALPAGLEGPQLIKHLQDRKAAQQKLKTYFQEQVDFLDLGGTVAGFLRKKQREVQSPQAATAEPAAGATQIGRFTVEAE